MAHAPQLLEYSSAVIAAQDSMSSFLSATEATVLLLLSLS